MRNFSNSNNKSNETTLYFESIEVDEINCPEKDVVLNGTIVKKGIVGKSINASGLNAFSIASENNIHLTNSSIGSISSLKGDVWAVNCPILGNIHTYQGMITAADCIVIDEVSSKGPVSLINCHVLKSVSTDSRALIRNTKIESSINVQRNITFIDSQVAELFCKMSLSMAPFISSSRIKTIYVEPAKHDPTASEGVFELHATPENKRLRIKLISSLVHHVVFDEKPGVVLCAKKSVVGKVTHGMARPLDVKNIVAKVDEVQDTDMDEEKATK